MNIVGIVKIGVWLSAVFIWGLFNGFVAAWATVWPFTLVFLSDYKR